MSMGFPCVSPFPERLDVEMLSDMKCLHGIHFPYPESGGVRVSPACDILKRPRSHRILPPMNFSRKGIFLLLLLLLGFFAPGEAKEAWFRMQIQQAPVGSQHLTWKRTSRGWTVNEDLSLHILMLGVEKKMESHTTAELTPGFSLRSFTFTLRTQDQDLRMQGTVQAGSLVVEWTVNRAQTSRRSFSLDQPVYLASAVVPALEEGKTLPTTLSLFDPSLVALSQARFERGRDSSGLRSYRLVYSGGSTVFWIRGKRVVLQTGALGLRSERVSKIQAEERISQSLDLLNLFAIRPRGPVERIGERSTLILKLYPIPDSSDLELSFGPQEVIQHQGDTFWVRITVRDPWRDPHRDPLPDSTPYLRDDPFLQSGDPEVRSLAESLVEGVDQPVARAERLTRWVFETLQKYPSVTIPTATEVLRDRKGDCNEHATLLGGLARAVGIPTEIVVGLVYQAGAYYYHAWDALYLDGRWIWADPVMGEFPARSNHLMLARGSLEEQAKLMPLVGKLQIEVVGP